MKCLLSPSVFCNVDIHVSGRRTYLKRRFLHRIDLLNHHMKDPDNKQFTRLLWLRLSSLHSCTTETEQCISLNIWGFKKKTLSVEFTDPLGEQRPPHPPRVYTEAPVVYQNVVIFLSRAEWQHWHWSLKTLTLTEVRCVYFLQLLKHTLTHWALFMSGWKFKIDELHECSVCSEEYKKIDNLHFIFILAGFPWLSTIIKSNQALLSFWDQ